MRGNGWYSNDLIDYCWKLNLITRENIKYVLYSSLCIKKDYFHKFIDFVRKDDDLSKKGVNTMVGCFKPKLRENWKTCLINTDRHVAFNHYLKSNACHIDARDINDFTYYQVYEQFLTTREETEAPIYQMILEQKAIELHKLMMIVESKQGVVLDLNTDCVSCVFPNDVLPFEIMDDGINIKNYYYGDNNELPRYK